VARALYSFFWNEYCDWYIEFAKGQLAQGGAARAATQRNLVFVLDVALRLLHPLMPFVTERIWQSIPHGDTRPSLMVAAWPDAAALAPFIDDAAEHAVDQVCAVVAAVRSTRARYGISPKEALQVAVRTLGDDDVAAQSAQALAAQALQVTTMARVCGFSVSPGEAKPAQSSVVIGDGLEIYIKLEGLVDFDVERARLEKERTKAAADLEKLDRKLANDGFLAKAAPEVVAKTREDAAALAAALDQIEAQLADLSA
jgi:valyl-tRNA synthetase